MDNYESSKPPTSYPSFYYGYIIVLCAFISMLAIYSLPLSYGIFFKPMATELKWNRTIVSGAYALSRIVGGVVTIAMGWLIDKMGPRIVLIICGLLCGIGFSLLSRIDTVWHLYIVYGVIIGFGSSVFAPMVSTVTKWFVQRRTLMTGIVISSLGIAMLVGPPISNLLISVYGWRLAYLIAGPTIGVVTIAVAQFMRRNPQQLGQAALVEENNGGGGSKSLNITYSLREAVNTRQFWIFFAMSICYAFCFLAVIVHLAPHMTDLAFSSTTAANVVATIGISSVIGLVLMGYIGDKIGNRKTIIIGYGFFSVAMSLLLFTKEIELLYLIAIMVGIAYAGVASQRPSIVAIMFGVKSHGLIFGAIDNSFMIGAAIGPISAGYLFDATGNYLLAFQVSTTIAVIGLILSIILNKTMTRQDGGYSG
jgi:MFS family permease